MLFQKKSLAVAVSLAVTPLAALAAPTLSWVKPSAGTSMYGAYSSSVVGCEVSGSGISRVKCYVDTREVNTANAAPYRCAFDTRSFSTGTKTLKALAIGTDGSTKSITRSVTFTSSATGSTTTPSNAAPSVSISAPTGTVSGTISLSAIAADDKAVSKVVFMVDSTTLATDTASPYSASLNTTTLANGTHTVKAQAFDAEGLSATSQVSINVQNGTTTTPPTSGTSTPAPGTGSLDVWFKAPKSGNTVSGVLSGATCYVAGTGVTRVAFKLDSTALNTDTTMADGMQCVLDTTKFPNGTHTLTAIATSSAGSTRSDVISINVQNATSGGGTGGSTGGSSGGTGSTGPMPTDSSGVRGVPTFQSIGMYWTNPGATSSGGCKMQYRRKGDSAWRDALDMWFDSRNSECRGSIVLLQPGTQYEVQMGLPGQSFKKGATVATWSEQFPIAQTITLPASSSNP